MKKLNNTNSSSDQFITKLEENEEIYNVKGVFPGDRVKILDIISKSAYNNDRAYEGCTRCVLLLLLNIYTCQVVKVLRK